MKLLFLAKHQSRLSCYRQRPNDGHCNLQANAWCHFSSCTTT